MRQRLTALLAGALCVLGLCLPASAANQVPEIDLEVALRDDGSAYVTQTWTAETDEGTEFYLACNDSGYLTISDFSVSDENGPYELVDHWDVDASFDEKAGRCGIVETDQGVELCWGITRYGPHRYAVEYVLHGLVGAYDDADGFHYRFVDAMSTYPSDVNLTIRRQDGVPLTDEDCAYWAFGFDGELQLEDGAVHAWTDRALTGEENVTLLLRLNQGVLHPERTGDGTFAALKDRAMEGSDYDTEEEPTTWVDWLITGVVMVAVVAVGFLLVSLAEKRRRAKANRKVKKADYFRDAPNRGNLNVTYHLGVDCDVCREGTLLGAYLLRLLSTGCLESEETGGTEAVRMRLVHPPVGENTLFDDTLYTILETAAGADGILQPGELGGYFQRNSKPLERFVASSREDALRALRAGGCLKDGECRNEKSLTPAGKEQLGEIMGLRRFLLDFSLIREREVRETVIWQDYMVYAVVMGIADKVMPQIRDLYPEMADQVDRYTRYIACAGYYDRMMYRAYEQERERLEAVRSAGHGGRSSFGGGGGFSGGGGGGTR